MEVWYLLVRYEIVVLILAENILLQLDCPVIRLHQVCVEPRLKLLAVVYRRAHRDHLEVHRLRLELALLGPVCPHGDGNWILLVQQKLRHQQLQLRRAL